MTDLYIGVMSGTSHDGIDAAIVDFHSDLPKLVATAFQPYPDNLRSALLQLNEFDQTPPLGPVLQAGRQFSSAVTNLLQSLLLKAELDSDAITAIGCHGHTVSHHPDGDTGYSFQLGDGAALAVNIDIPVICDFRSADIALGGTGAPLAPAFHQYAFSSTEENRVIANIGGIANLTILPNDGHPCTGFDTGPGNLLMDFWMERQFGERYDNRGDTARRGNVINPLLAKLMAHPFFAATPPKSTGREMFNGPWLLQQAISDAKPDDVMATLAEVTARSIALSVKQLDIKPGGVYVCGGGHHNDYLMQRIETLIAPWTLGTTADLDLHPDWVEAAAFAWLARQRWLRQPGNLPEVTGAVRKTTLGAIHLP